MKEEGLPNNFNIKDVQKVHWLCRGGMRVDYLWRDSLPTASLQETVTNFKPSHVYIELGTCDLAKATFNEAISVARDVAELVLWLLEEGVKFVICGKVLYRLKDKRKIPRTARYDYGVDLKSFEDHRQLLARNLHATLPSQARLWVHSKLEARKSYICDDGVHLTRNGTKRFYYSLRGSILLMSKKPTAQLAISPTLTQQGQGAHH